MLSYSSPLQEGKRWVFTFALFLIGGDLWGLWGTEVAAWPLSGKTAAPELCPMSHYFIPRGSQAFIPIRRSSNFSILCKVNASSGRCNWVLVTSKAHTYYFNVELKRSLILQNKGLFITRMTMALEGEYQILSGLNRTCEGQIWMTSVGRAFVFRIFLLIPSAIFLCAACLTWDWLIKVRSRSPPAEELQTPVEIIQHVIPLLLPGRNP